MSVLPVSGVSAVTAPSGLSSLTGTSSVGSTSGSDFDSLLSGGVDSLQQLQSTSNSLAVQAVTGDLDDVHDYTIAAAKASTAMELTAAVRNQAVSAYQEIMRMQA